MQYSITLNFSAPCFEGLVLGLTNICRCILNSQILQKFQMMVRAYFTYIIRTCSGALTIYVVTSVLTTYKIAYL